MRRRVVEVMFAGGCPHLQDVIARVRDATLSRECAGEVEIHLVLVATMVEARERGFLGSPTVRVDGRDVEPNLTSTMFGLHGRGYFVDGRVERLPPSDWIQQAL
jgi:hypothetical protein